MTVELVVLLDHDGNAVGTAPKDRVHGSDTPLHLAFSAYLFSAGGDLLVTRRALTKRAFPGVWTNSVCGHPAPGESLTAAVARRTMTELGAQVSQLRLVLPEFSYRAEQDRIVENELCPVFTGILDAQTGIAPQAAEVAETSWTTWTQFSHDVLRGDRQVSPWCTDQVRQLAALGPSPGGWPAADPALLPRAAELA